jgi:EmrB/QacA subfamily drug resistance transporter
MTPEAPVPQPAPVQPPMPVPTRNLFFRVFPSIVLPMFLAAIDSTIVATALPDMAASLGDVERVSWVVVSYLMATTIAAAVHGRLGDALGRKRLLLVSLVLFIVASAACALAPTMLLLVAARVAQGIGGGGLMTLSQALIGEVVPPRERGRYQGYMASVFMVASTFGPVAGGWLTQHFGWASVFWVNVPLGGLAVVMAMRLPSRAGAGGVRFDWLGLALFTSFVVPLVLALEQAQRISFAVAPGIAVLTALAAAALFLLLKQERRSSFPLIPVNLLRQSAIWRADAMGACVGATLVSSITFMPIYLQVVRGASPGEVGWLLLPLTAGVAMGSMLTGRVISRTGRTAIFPSIGQGVVTGCMLFMALGAAYVPIRQLPWVFLLLSMSIGTTMPVVQVTVQTVAGAKNLGAASASVQFSRSIGAALGTAIVGAVLFAVLAFQDPATARLFAAIVERGPGVLATLSAEMRATLAVEIAGAFRAAFLAISCFSAGAMLLAWSLPMRRI